MASGVWRARTPAAALAAARAAAAGVAAGLAAPLAAAAALAAAPSPTPSPPPSGGVESAQDVTLEALGVPTQTLYGGANSVAAFFPPPPGALAASGSLLRLVFSHSPLLDPAASTATALVNGQELGTVAMDGSTANGGVADLKVPAGALSGDRANLVEVRFQVRLTGRPAAPGTDDPSAFVRLESQTLLRYQLFVPPGAPPPARLDAYPFPLLTTHGAAPARLGLVLPAPPNPADLAAGFRLVADLGRRGAGQQVAPEAVTFGQLDWLRAGGLPALVVGGLRRLPAADPLLRAAGFTTGPSGWIAPDGQVIGPDDGLIVAARSPWDRRSPVVLVTGDSDAAVVRAAASLAAPASPPGAGTFAVVPPDAAPAPAPAGPRPGDNVSFDALGDQDLRVDGPGPHAVSLAFTAPAVDPAGTGDLVIAGDGSTARLTAVVNGTALGSLALDRAAAVHLRVPGSILRPGRNTLTLDIAPAGDGEPPGAAPDARLRLPGPAPAAAGLELLPHPVFDDPAGVRLVLGGSDDALLTGAARVVAALGGRSTVTPRVVAGYADAARGDGGLLVVGVPVASIAAARVAAAVGLRAAPAPAGGAPPIGAVRELAGGGRPVLWVDGTGADAVALAGDALARGQLAGAGATVDAAGRVRALVAAAPVPVPEPGTVTAVKVMVAVAACLLVAGVAWQAWRPCREDDRR